MGRETRQRVVQDWRLIESRDDLLAVADLLETDRTTRQSRTSITAALRFGARYFDDNGLEGTRRVIDISGDGPNNQAVL